MRLLQAPSSELILSPPPPPPPHTPPAPTAPSLSPPATHPHPFPFFFLFLSDEVEGTFPRSPRSQSGQHSIVDDCLARRCRIWLACGEAIRTAGERKYRDPILFKSPLLPFRKRVLIVSTWVLTKWMPVTEQGREAVNKLTWTVRFSVALRPQKS